MRDVERELRELGTKARNTDRGAGFLSERALRRVKLRRFAAGATGALLATVAVTVALAAGGFDSGGGKIDPAQPSPTGSPSAIVEGVDDPYRCRTPDFVPSYLPEGWSGELQPHRGSGLEAPGVAGHWGTVEEAPSQGDYVDLLIGKSPYHQFRSSEITVLGDRASMGETSPGRSIEFSHEGCDFTLHTASMGAWEFRAFAKGLRPTGDGNHATGPRVMIATGRFLGVDWEYYGYQSNDGLCLEFAWGRNSGGGCGFREPPRDYVLSVGGISHLREPGVATVAEFDGQVSDAVERLMLEVGDAEPEIVELVDPPRRLGLEDRRFVHLIDTRKLDPDSRVWLVAYHANGRVLERQEVRGLPAPEGRQGVTPDDEREDFAAIWPEDTYEHAREACEAAGRSETDEVDGEDNNVSVRSDPQSVVLEFGSQVLGWLEGETFRPRVDVRSDRTVYGLRRGDDGGTSPRDPEVLVDAIEVQPGCWSVAGVSRMPDERPTGVSVSVRGRDVRVGVDPLGATSLAIRVAYAGRDVGESGPVGEEGLGEFQLPFDPDTRGYALILFLDEEGAVFSATSASFPAGDFAAG